MRPLSKKDIALASEILDLIMPNSDFSVVKVGEAKDAVDAEKHDVVLGKILRRSKKISYGVYEIDRTVILGRLPIDHIPTYQTSPTEQPDKAVAAAVDKELDSQDKVIIRHANRTVEVNDSALYVPAKDPNYVGWGEFSMIKKVIDSFEFTPLYICGLSGNGKTFMIEQACAHTNREYIRVQISPETDEDDLIGGFRLIDGNTVFEKGPAVKAYERGAILLIDEIDRGTNKIMCLQGILEGKPIMIKKTGELIHPKKGFNVFATANTSGSGSVDGKYAAANIIDDAFLERFVATINQPYPTAAVEKKILRKHCKSLNIDYKADEHQSLITCLSSWSESVRKVYASGGIAETISTRRLCHILKLYSIFNDRKKSVEWCINKFDEDTRGAMLDFYSSIDDKIAAELAAPDSQGLKDNDDSADDQD